MNNYHMPKDGCKIIYKIGYGAACEVHDVWIRFGGAQATQSYKNDGLKPSEVFSDEK